MDLQKQKFSCVTQRFGNFKVHNICKSRNFLVLLNHSSYPSIISSAKAEIFLCYSTVVAIQDVAASAKAEIFLCYSTLKSACHVFYICKSRNFLVLLN